MSLRQGRKGSTSSRSGSVTDGNGKRKNLPPSHPAEQSSEHRQFLMRSLDRNDKDLAALMDLNRSLHAVKSAIVETCGELTLLDLGEGKIRLRTAVPMEQQDDDGDCLEGDNLPQQGQDLCVDFLLRMKLRRKLLNRLARRLHRLSHAMDGNDVTPPAPPRYGDLRLHIDPEAVKQCDEQWKRQQEALLMMDLEREKSLSGITSKGQNWDHSENEAHRLKYVSDDDKKTKPAQPAANEEDNQKEKQEKKSDGPGSNVKDDTVRPASTTDEEKDAEESRKPEPNPVSSSEAANFSAAQSGAAAPLIDYEALKSYNDAYQRLVDRTTGSWTYKILDQDVEEDYVKIKFGAGIGASHRSMSTKEKEAEFKRWQSALLSRVPEQPTFDELGMDNNVFLLEERRKKALKDEEEQKKLEDGNNEGSCEVSGERADGQKDDMDIDKEETNANEGKGKSSDNGRRKDEDDPSKMDGTKGSANEETNDTLGKRMKPISLAAVPTFYEQDLKRTKIVHSELMAASMHDRARSRLHDVTRAYNAALRTSNEASASREQAEMRVHHVKFQLHQMQELKRRFSNEKQHWLMGYRQFNRSKLKQMLPSYNGKQPVGTPLTQQYGSRPDIFSQQVGACLADVVDAVDMVDRGMLHLPRYSAVPPTEPQVDIERLKQLVSQLESERESRIRSLVASEEARKHAWKKMLKTKAEFEVPHQQRQSYGSRKGMMVNLSNYHTIPLPILRHSYQEQVPNQMIEARPSLPSYVPARSPVQPSKPASESRYSAARVRERISEDGTVAPVSEPKQTKDGLYLRPAGRTRKGMEWDAVRGIWVPQSGSS